MNDEEHPVDVKRQAVVKWVVWLGETRHADWYSSCLERADARDEVSEVRGWAKEAQDSARDSRLLEQYHWKDSENECNHDHNGAA